MGIWSSLLLVVPLKTRLPRVITEWDHWSKTGYSTLTYGSTKSVVHAGDHTQGTPLGSGAKLSEGRWQLAAVVAEGMTTPIYSANIFFKF